ncbi:MAG TPA: transketolase [Anaerovoracaceae bacterium]|nr:transketolase [Anaerovoracaceae bacterium]
MQQYLEKSREIRKEALKMIAAAASGHPGGSLSATDLLVALYYRELSVDPNDPRNIDRDRFVLSKGHAAPALYAILADKGYFPKEVLRTFRQLGSPLQGQPDRKKTLGVDACAGSIGQGVSVAVGMALGAKRAGKTLKVYAMMGDGELQEGQVWEAAMSAAHYGLDNLTFIVDNNGIQLLGRNDEIMALGNIADKFRVFGFQTIEIDGHDFAQIFTAFDVAGLGRPKCIVAHTVKGKGVSFMENDAAWHGKAPGAEQLQQALAELDG